MENVQRNIQKQELPFLLSHLPFFSLVAQINRSMTLYYEATIIYLHLITLKHNFCVFWVIVERKTNAAITPTIVTNIDTIENWEKSFDLRKGRTFLLFLSCNETCKNIYSSIEFCYKNVATVIESGAYRLEIINLRARVYTCVRACVCIYIYILKKRKKKGKTKSGDIGKRFRLVHTYVAYATKHKDHVDVQMNEQQHEQRVPSLFLPFF